MDEVEVDVKLFITCRMCLDEPGVYQIVPSLRQLIKFCFDIDIEPFDGLPQLICKKCKSTLSEYHETKTNLLIKQKQLKQKLFKKPKTRTPSPEIKNCNINNEDGESSDSPIAAPVQAAPQRKNRQVNNAWKKAYNEYFMCKICSKSYLRLSSIKRHISNHNMILNKHKKVFRNYCTVQLNKIDEEPNGTGCSNVVVYDKDKVILDKGNSRYHSFYLKKEICDYLESDEDKKECSSLKRRAMLSDSSEDEIRKGKKKRKSRRLFSSSSTQTTVLDDSKADCDTSNKVAEPNALNNYNDNDKDLVHAECINIDDTSSDCPTKNKFESDALTALREQKPAKATVANYKAIQSIVTMCHKKYLKKVQSESDTLNKPCEYSLKRKILSLGRKVIHKQGFECTGLLRYMEHKDLEVKWQSANHGTQNKSSNLVRIMPKRKSREDSENDDNGWKDLYKINFLYDQIVSDGVSESNSLNKVVVDPIKTNNEDTLTCPPDLTNEDKSDQVFSTISANDLYYTNKLLNKTPVPNPKQLPKKNGTAETKPISNDPTMLQPFEVSGEIENAAVEDNNFGMPIITSTQSLSNIHNVTEADPVVDKPAPRIKVKPASELMSDRALSASEDIWAMNKRYISVPCHLTNTTVYVASPMSQTQTDHKPINHLVTIVAEPPARDDKSPIDKTNLGDPSDKNLEFVTLNTLELPNTKTKSPFQYFKTILLYHGLILLELNEELPAHFNCLVKFRLFLKQDTKQPLEVVLSLFCSNNNFCFNFKDSKLKKFDPNQLPAFWQWELLKVYKSDAVNKILQNAMKISKEVHENTKKFLCLLKSIKLIT